HRGIRSRSGCNGQVKYRCVLTYSTHRSISIHSTLCVGLASPGVRGTCTHRGIRSRSGCNGQLQRNGILTTLCIGNDVIMVACSSVRLSITTPGELLTCCHQRIGVYSVCDRQLQRNGILTTLCIGNDVIMVACSSVRLSITTPGELL